MERPASNKRPVRLARTEGGIVGQRHGSFLAQNGHGWAQPCNFFVYPILGRWHNTRWRVIGENGIFVLHVPKTDSNLPTEPLRWSLYRAAIEFSSTEPTLLKKLQEQGTVPDPVTHTYTSLQILAALSHGDSKALRDREVRERGDNWALRNAELRRELLPAQTVYRCLEGTFTVIRQEILGSPLPQDTINSILSHLAECEIPQ
jgi:hypothetical protein